MSLIEHHAVGYAVTMDIRENTYMTHEYIRARIHEWDVFGGSLIFSPAYLNSVTQSHMHELKVICNHHFKIMQHN